MVFKSGRKVNPEHHKALLSSSLWALNYQQFCDRVRVVLTGKDNKTGWPHSPFKDLISFQLLKTWPLFKPPKIDEGLVWIRFSPSSSNQNLLISFVRDSDPRLVSRGRHPYQ